MVRWGRVSEPTVHPHGCGEDSLLVSSATQYTRFTPTGVGKMGQTHPTSFSPSSVHPHGCGEDVLCSWCILWDGGSPPRVWGRCFLELVKGFGVGGSPPRVWGRWVRSQSRCSPYRFTPTGVGKIFAEAIEGDRHLGSPPRVWGRLLMSVVVLRQLPGSPPRVWGR